MYGINVGFIFFLQLFTCISTVINDKPDFLCFIFDPPILSVALRLLLTELQKLPPPPQIPTVNIPPPDKIPSGKVIQSLMPPESFIGCIKENRSARKRSISLLGSICYFLSNVTSIFTNLKVIHENRIATKSINLTSFPSSPPSSPPLPPSSSSSSSLPLPSPSPSNPPLLSFRRLSSSLLSSLPPPFSLLHLSHLLSTELFRLPLPLYSEDISSLLINLATHYQDSLSVCFKSHTGHFFFF